MIKLNPNKPTTMKFRVNITGTNENASARIFFKKGNSFTGYNTPIENGIVEIIVPSREFKNGDNVSSLVEIVVGNQVYTPWKEQILFEEQFKIEVDPIIEQEETESTESIHIEQEEVTVEPLIEQEEEIVKEIKEKIKINKLEEMFSQMAKKKK